MEDGTRNKRERKLGRGRARGRVRGGLTWRTGDGVAAPTAGQASHPAALPRFPIGTSPVGGVRARRAAPAKGMFRIRSTLKCRLLAAGRRHLFDFSLEPALTHLVYPDDIQFRIAGRRELRADKY
ncbi:uncharacterized protein CIMG_11700 [Coccidioides immitis RS]|uniref:Uncharacterized protein n=2 Tax=Coccidioides immitis TaxID=5501 RepID=A0A0D8JTA3_COCIM|nr:uncharacterized protein CIMG_11700 [Coccidioides immitis RS]KJF60527.1 hypothetical protein CIMG_11700 [Coccidioides immitis RS]